MLKRVGRNIYTDRIHTSSVRLKMTSGNHLYNILYYYLFISIGIIVNISDDRHTLSIANKTIIRI